MKEAVATLKEKINDNFAIALNKVVPDIIDILEDKLADNESSDTGEQSTQLTIQPKIRIEFAQPSDYVIKVTIPVKSIHTRTGESEDVKEVGHVETVLEIDRDEKVMALRRGRRDTDIVDVLLADLVSVVDSRIH